MRNPYLFITINDSLPSSSQGTSLDSIGEPTLNVTMVHTIIRPAEKNGSTSESTSFLSECSAKSSTKMKCIYPRMTIPKQFLNTTEKQTINDLPADSSKAKNKEIFKLDLGEEILQIYLGFKLDGYKKYLNLTQSFPNRSKLDIVVSKPTFEPFEELKLFYPTFESFIVIWGERIDDVFQVR